jgi:hypothetical protein
MILPKEYIQKMTYVWIINRYWLGQQRISFAHVLPLPIQSLKMSFHVLFRINISTLSVTSDIREYIIVPPTSKVITSRLLLFLRFLICIAPTYPWWRELIWMRSRNWCHWTDHQRSQLLIKCIFELYLDLVLRFRLVRAGEGYLLFILDVLWKIWAAAWLFLNSCSKSLSYIMYLNQRVDAQINFLRLTFKFFSS